VIDPLNQRGRFQRTENLGCGHWIDPQELGDPRLRQGFPGAEPSRGRQNDELRMREAISLKSRPLSTLPRVRYLPQQKAGAFRRTGKPRR
jgi:hypothetical protein